MRESDGQHQVSVCLQVFLLPSPSSAVLRSAVLWASCVSVPGSTVWLLILGRERFSQWQDHRSVSVLPPGRSEAPWLSVLVSWSWRRHRYTCGRVLQF